MTRVFNIFLTFLIGASFLLTGARGFAADFESRVQCVDIVFPKGSGEEVIPARLKNVPPEVKSRKRFKLDVWRHFVNRSTGRSSRFSLLPTESGYRIGEAGFIKKGRYSAGARNARSQLANGFRVWVDPLETELSSGSKGKTLFERNQFFPLKVMKDEGYLSEEELQAQLTLSKKNIDARQVTFIEATEEVRQQELIGRYGEIPPTARMSAAAQATVKYLRAFDDYVETHDHTYENKVGSCWMVAGQLNGKRAGLAAEDSRLLNPIDRKRYPYVWEIGRAAQTEDSAFSETLRVAVYVALHELILSGGKLEDAYFFGHALDRRRAAVFRRTYGMKHFSHYKDSVGETLLMVPLKDLILKFGISDLIGGWTSKSFSEEHSEVVMRLRSDLIQWQNRSMGAKGNETSVVLRDFTPVGVHVVRGSPTFKSLPSAVRTQATRVLSTAEPLQERRDSLADFLEESSKPYVLPIHGVRSQRQHDPNQGLMHVNRYGLMELAEFLTEQRSAVEVTIVSDAGGVSQIQLFIAAYEDYLARLRSRGFQDPVGFLKAQNVEFALTTQDSQTEQLLSNEVRSGAWFMHRDRTVSTSSHWAFNMEQEVVSAFSMWSTAFTIDQMETLRQGRGAIGSLPKVRLRPSSYHRDQMMGHPDLIF